METDLHLQISQHQASLKHENFTLSYHTTFFQFMETFLTSPNFEWSSPNLLKFH